MGYLPRYLHIQQGYYVIAVVLLVASIIVGRKISMGLFIAYSFLVIVTTILRRIPGEQASVILTPFWSYREMNTNDFIWFEVRANILMFIPIGILLPLCIKKKPLLWGIGFSVVIELIQLITHKGTCETDDVISNTIGFLIGYAIITILRLLFRFLFGLWQKYWK